MAALSASESPSSPGGVRWAGGVGVLRYNRSPFQWYNCASEQGVQRLLPAVSGCLQFVIKGPYAVMRADTSKEQKVVAS